MKSINGVGAIAPTTRRSAATSPSRLFLGNLVFGTSIGTDAHARATAATSAASSTRASQNGQLIQIAGAGAGYDGDVLRHDVTRRRAHADAAIGVGAADDDGLTSRPQPPDARRASARARSRSRSTRPTDRSRRPNCRRLVHADRRRCTGRAGSPTASSRASGSRSATRRDAATAPLQDRRSSAATTRPRTTSSSSRSRRRRCPPGSTGTLNVKVTRARRSRAFTDFDDANWYARAEGRPRRPTSIYAVPITREGVKVFPVSTHVPLEAAGPLAVEGGVTGADRSLQPRREAAGREGRPAVRDRHAAAGVEADRRPEHLQRRQPAGPHRHDDLDHDQGPRHGRRPRLRPDVLEREPADVRRAARSSRAASATARSQFVDGKFATDGGKSTIEVVNLMLGAGQRQARRSRHARPGRRRSSSPARSSSRRTAHGHRPPPPAPFDWKAQGFLVGQTVTISGPAGRRGRSRRSTTTSRQRTPTQPAAPARAASTRHRQPARSQRQLDPRAPNPGHPLPVLAGEQTIIATDKLVTCTTRPSPSPARPRAARSRKTGDHLGLPTASWSASS